MIHQPFFVPSALFVLLAIPLVLGWVPRNRFYGIRTRRALADDAAWYRINRGAAWSVIVSAAFYLGVAWLFPIPNPRDGDFHLWLVHLAAFGLPLLASFMLLGHAARKSG